MFPWISIIRLYASFSFATSSSRVWDSPGSNLWNKNFQMYTHSHVAYHRISSGFLRNSLLSHCLTGILIKSISDISAEILKIIKINALLLIKTLPKRLRIKNAVHKINDSLIRQFGLSKVWSLYHK